MRWNSFSLVGCVLLGFLLLLAGCKSDPTSETLELAAEETPSPTNAESPQSSGSAKKVSGDVDVDIIGGTFVPETVTISVGETVTWTNKDAEDHSVSFSEESILDTVLDPGETVENTFDTAGAYKYKDKFSGAKGEVVVE